MPELPEVETTRRHLAAALEGRRITQVVVGRPRMIRRQPRPRDFAERLQGRRVGSWRRIGKTIVADVDPFLWISHLGMSGRMQLASPGTALPAHANVIVDFAGGRQLRFVDPRTFGHMTVLTPEEYATSPTARLGPDALDALPSAVELAARLEGRTAPIKSLLLDQHFLAGLGNIYADEVLWRAHVRPDRPGGSLRREEVVALRAAVRPVLRAGLRAGGTSLDDLAYLLPDGRAGEFASLLDAYGRDGEPCRRCGSNMERLVLRARGATWCPGCQK